MRTIFDKLDNVYAKYYKPTKHLAVSEAICVLTKVGSSLNSVYQRNTKPKSCVDQRDTRTKTRNIQLPVSTTHATMMRFTTRTEGLVHKLHFSILLAKMIIYIRRPLIAAVLPDQIKRE